MISRLTRKRRARRANIQPDHPFTITSCEYLTDGAFALLRVGGTGSAVPVALVTQGDGPEAFDPLPQPDEGVHDGKWQIAFALPTEVIEPGARVWLHDGGLYLADLRIPAAAETEPVQAHREPQPEPVEDQHAKLGEALREEVARLEQELAAMHSEDREARRQIEQLGAELAERDQRIEHLQQEAESFTARRDEAVAESLRERIAALEADLRQRDAANDDLRRQLVRASAAQASPGPVRPDPRVVASKSPNGTPSPPWSALDDELLARIEKAKALTS